MYEYHGWITVRTTYENTDEVDETEERLWENINGILDSKIKSISWMPGLTDLRYINGNCYITLAGYTNHRGPDSKEINNLYKFIAEIAPGSYGVLYEQDDEDIEGFNNKFKVKVLKRGKFINAEDTFLSPCVPEIEDEYNHS